MATPLQEVQQLYTDKMGLALDDRPMADYLFSAMVANQLRGTTDPIWGWLVGPPGSGKNEGFQVFRGHPTTFFCTTITQNALMSGHKDDENPTEDPSLLPALDGKTLVIEESAALLGMGEFAMDKIMGDLRNLYGEEEQSKASGSAGVRIYQAKFGILMGATPAVDSVLARHQQLGERFVALRISRRAAHRPMAARISSLKHVRGSMKTKKVWRKELKLGVQTAYNTVLSSILKDGEAVHIDPATEDQMYQLSDLVARLRTVPVQGMAVDPETGNRLIQQFVTLGTARALSDNRHYWHFNDTLFVQRIANDTLPRWVVELLCLLAPVVEDPARARPSIPYSNLAHRITAINPQLLSMYIRQYRYLGLVTPESSAAHNGSIQLAETTLDQLRASGLLFGERGHA